jgi:hypothetical protein
MAIENISKSINFNEVGGSRIKSFLTINKGNEMGHANFALLP